MDNQVTSKQYKMAVFNAFNPFFQTMERRYTNYQLKLAGEDPSSRASAAMRYVSEFTEAGVTSESIETYARSILDERKYSARPPTPREFVFEIRDRIKLGGGLWGPVSALFDRMQGKYRQLWSGLDQKETVVKEILTAIDGLIDSDDPIVAAEKRIASDPEFRTYPPTPGRIAEVILLMAKDPEVPMVSESYSLAVRRTGEKHPLIRYARTEFGAHTLRTRTDSRVKPDFEDLYSGFLRDYAYGDLDLDAAMRTNQASRLSDKPGNEHREVLGKDELLNILF